MLGMLDLGLIKKRLAKATPGPLYVELDDPMAMRTVYRVIEQAALKRRKEMNSSARPAYIATVYSQADAEFYANVSKDMEDLIREVEKAKRYNALRNIASPLNSRSIYGKSSWEDLTYVRSHDRHGVDGHQREVDARC